MPVKHLTLYTELFAAADRYFNATPWERLAAELPICVENPRTGKRSLCIGMGGSGIVRGLAVYVGDRGRSAYDTTVRYADSFSGYEEEVSPTWALYCQHTLKLEFVNADEKTDFTKDLHRELGLRFRGRMRHPQAEWFAGGVWPQNELDEEQIRHLTECLDVVAEVASRPINEIDQLYEYAEEGGQDYVFQAAGDGWRESSLPLIEIAPWFVLPRPGIPAMILPKPPSEHSPQQLAVLVFPMNTPIDDPRDAAPYFPIIGIVVNTSNGQIVGQQVFSPWSLADHIGEWFGKIVQQFSPLNTLIPCADTPTEYLLQGFAQRYGFVVQAFPNQEAFGILRQSLLEMRAR